MRTAVQTLVLVVAFTSVASASNMGFRLHGADPCRIQWNWLSSAEWILVLDRREGAASSTRDAWSARRPGVGAGYSVREVWKGEGPPNATVSILPGSLPGPGPWLAFLTRGDESEPVSAARSNFLPLLRCRVGRAELGPTRDLVMNGVELQATAHDQEEARLDWLVEAASHAATRRHGLLILVGHVSRERLTSALLQRLADGFVREPPSIGHAGGLLRLLGGFASEDLDAEVAALVDRELLGPSPSFGLNGLLAAAVKRSGADAGALRLALSCSAGKPLSLPDARSIWDLARGHRGRSGVDPTSGPSRGR